MNKKKKPLHILIYGDPGTGKSIFASTFPRCLYFDFDNGTNEYESYFTNNKYLRGENLISYLSKAISQIQAGTFEYETIVIDSLTNLENTAVSKFKDLNINNWNLNLYSARQKKLNYDDWGNISGSTISLLNYMRTLPVNVVIITQVDQIKDNGSLKNAPMLIGKGQLESMHFADIVGYFYTTKDDQNEKLDRMLALSSKLDNNFYAKARTLRGYINPIKNPNYDKLYKVLNSDEINLNFED